MSALTGHCHCGAIQASLEPAGDLLSMPYRACQCGFCRRHGARTTSHPDAWVHLVAAPGSVRRYRFGRRSVDAVLCRECGVYVGSVLASGDRLFSTINVAGLNLPGFEGRVAEHKVYDDETDEQRLARRLARWSPSTLVETVPSA